jgi:pimeloyl-ACP methyl ester carboxylesterase
MRSDASAQSRSRRRLTTAPVTAPEISNSNVDGSGTGRIEVVNKVVKTDTQTVGNSKRFGGSTPGQPSHEDRGAGMRLVREVRNVALESEWTA